MGLRVQVDGFKVDGFKVVVTASLQNIFAAELLPSFLIFPPEPRSLKAGMSG